MGLDIVHIWGGSMKKFISILCLLSLLFVSFVVSNSCNDEIDNDGDGDEDLDDVGCLDSSDGSERDYGYQIEFIDVFDETDLTSVSCLNSLVSSGISCVENHYEDFSWIVAFFNPETFSSCLNSYSSEYFNLVYDSEKEYTKIAVADCVYDHYSEFESDVILAAGSVSNIENICFEIYYEDYSSSCVDEVVVSGCVDDSDCASGFVCDSGAYYETFECVECIMGEDMCGSGFNCEDYVCVERDVSCGAFSVDSLGNCLTSCVDSYDCFEGYACDSTGDCSIDSDGNDVADVDEVSSSGPSMAAGLEESFFAKFLGWLIFWN